MNLIIKDKSRLFVYLISLVIFVILVSLGFLYPFWESYEIAHPKPKRYEAREDAVPEIDMHPKFQAEDFYEGKLSYKKPSIINQLSPSSTIFIHSISWDTTTSGFIHTVGTMLYTPIKVRSERVHKTNVFFVTSVFSDMVTIDSTALSRLSIQTIKFSPPVIVPESSAYRLDYYECYWK